MPTRVAPSWPTGRSGSTAHRSPRPICPRRWSPALGTSGDRAIVLEADRAVSYGAVVSVVDAARAAGVERIGVATNASANAPAIPPSGAS